MGGSSSREDVWWLGEDEIGNGFDLNAMFSCIKFLKNKSRLYQIQERVRIFERYSTVNCAVIAMLNVKQILNDFMIQPPKSKTQNFILCIWKMLPIYWSL